MTPEGRVKAMVKRELAALGDQCWKFMPVQSGYGSPALDFITCINGWFVAIETKKDSKAKLTPLQLSTKSDMEAAGGIVLVVYDRDSLDRAMKIIKIIAVGAEHADRNLRAILAPWLAQWSNDATPQDEASCEQHVCIEQQVQATDPATGRDHGAPRKKSPRHAKPAASGDDQPVTAAVTPHPPTGE